MISLEKKSCCVHSSSGRSLVDSPPEVDDEVAGPDARVDNEDTLVGEGLAELLLEHLHDAGTHEVHDFLRGVDDARRVGCLYREPWKNRS